MQQPDNLDRMREQLRQGMGPAETLQGANFCSQVLDALGLGGLKRITALQLEFDTAFVAVKVTQLITREQGSALAAVLRQRRWMMVGSPQVVGESTIAGAVPDPELRPTPEIRPPAL